MEPAPNPPSTTPATLSPPREPWLRFGMRGVHSAAASVLIAACIWAVTKQPFGINVVYSMCIAVTCWFIIDSSRLLVARALRASGRAASPASDRWPGWPWMMAIVVVGALLGYAVGNEIANRLTGRTSPGLLDADARKLASLLVMALVPAVTITYFFKLREVMAAQRIEVERAERQAAEQRLKLLESQLEPHMLFNTLANLRALIGVDPERAQAMLDRLIAFLRASLAGSRETTHPLAVEIERVRDYLALMAIRMGPRLTVGVDVPADAAALPVPTLILQPLAENAIKHGLEPKREGGRIDLRARREGAELLVEVVDSGLGPAMNVGDGGFGLAHVRERLATLYGERARFVLEPAAGGGTRAALRLPIDGASAAAARSAGDRSMVDGASTAAAVGSRDRSMVERASAATAEGVGGGSASDAARAAPASRSRGGSTSVAADTTTRTIDPAGR